MIPKVCVNMVQRMTGISKVKGGANEREGYFHKIYSNSIKKEHVWHKVGHGSLYYYYYFFNVGDQEAFKGKTTFSKE